MTGSLTCLPVYPMFFCYAVLSATTTTPPTCVAVTLTSRSEALGPCVYRHQWGCRAHELRPHPSVSCNPSNTLCRPRALACTCHTRSRGGTLRSWHHATQRTLARLRPLYASKLIDAYFALYPPKYPAVIDCATCTWYASSSAFPLSQHRFTSKRSISCVSGSIGTRKGNLISSLSPEDSAHPVGAAGSQGLLRETIMLPIALLGPVGGNPRCAAMQWQISKGFSVISFSKREASFAFLGAILRSA